MLSIHVKSFTFFLQSLYKKLLVSFFSIAILSTFSLSANAIELGDEAIDFQLQTLSGKTFQLSDYKGKKPVYLIFWATWCPICKAEVPEFKKLHEKLGDKIEFLAINVGFQDTLEKAIKYKEEHQLPYQVTFDDNTVITKEYGIVGTPWQVVIDINGFVRYSSNYTPVDFEDHLADLMKKRG